MIVLCCKKITVHMNWEETGSWRNQTESWNFTVCALSKERLGSNGRSAEICTVREADILDLQWCLPRDVRVEKPLLPCEKCCCKALVGTQKETHFFFVMLALKSWLRLQFAQSSRICMAALVWKVVVCIEIRLNKGKTWVVSWKEVDTFDHLPHKSN